MKVTDEMVTDAMNTYLHISPDGVNTAGLRAVLEQVLTPAQPAPVVGGSDWYAEQHARDSKELRKLCESRDFYKRRCDSLQALQPNMRDPERKAVCDILANGTTTALSTRPAESVDEEMTRLMEIHGVSDLPALVRMLLRFNENLRSRQRPDPQILQRAPREG